jgi:hypothetical protein
MAENQVIDLTPDYSYFFTTVLEGLNVQFKVRWNIVDLAWYIDLDIIETETLVKGIKLIGGIDLLKQYAITELGKMFIVDTEEKFQDPDFDLIGDRYKLIYILKENRDDISF